MDFSNLCKLMYKSYQFTVTEVQPYLPIFGIYADDVVVVDRNGIGIKHTQTFGGAEIKTVYTYEHYSIKQVTINSNNYLIPVVDEIVFFPSTERTMIFEVGPAPTAGIVYSLYFDTVVAKYKVQVGDTTENVRDGLQAAVNAASWGTTIVTTPLYTNQLQLVITGDTVYPRYQLGEEKFKKGYYVLFGSVYYALFQAESLIAFPVLPSIALSYSINSITKITGTMEASLYEPYSQYFYTTSVGGSTDITDIPTIGSVNPGECVIDVFNQRIWFDGNLNFGEIIKLFVK